MIEDKPACYKSCSNDLLDDTPKEEDTSDSIHQVMVVGCVFYLVLMCLTFIAGLISYLK